MTKIHDLQQLGQSIWLDYIRRQFITNGGLQASLQDGVRGVTSNPSIFEKAIAGSMDYDVAMKPLAEAGQSVEEIYDALVIEDIQMAADILRPIYDESGKVDGYISLEVSPTLAHDTDGTVADARRYWAAVDRPNLMIKVPATPEGIPAIETLISEGINVNVTLMFNMHHYEDVANAYINGIETLVANGGDASDVASVASFFVSRVETAVDNALEEKGNTELLGKIAVANSQVVYKRFKELFGDERWNKLADAGARVQRPLWASTSTKNPQYPDTKYVDSLIGEHTVNTVPPNTLDAFTNNGTAALTIEDGLAEAEAALSKLDEIGIDLGQITQDLQDAGVASFAKSFESLMGSIAEKRDKLADGQIAISTDLGEYQQAVDAATEELRDHDIMRRIWAHDHTVWDDSEDEISNRLGWLHIMDELLDDTDRIQQLVQAVKDDGITHILLIGMGGSSLAPEVFSLVFGPSSDGLWLEILDSTDPGAVLHYDERLDKQKTLFIISTKSGGTAETLSGFKYFYNRTLEAYDGDQAAAGRHFVAITDPGSKLIGISERYHFRSLFLNNPNIGGRYSVLSHFGIVPAALVGVDIEKLLDRAKRMAVNCDANNCPSAGDNMGGILGAVMGDLCEQGRDKLTIITSPAIAPFGDWAEQLIAESTGKDGKGILPVVGEALGTPEVYSDDRIFAYMKLAGDDTYDTQIDALKAAGYPVITLHLDDLYDLGGQFFLWEMATAVAGHRLGIHPFNQPNVEAAKNSARAKIKEYEETGKLEELPVALSEDGIKVYGDVVTDSPAEALKTFLDRATNGSYISLHAYVKPDEATTEALQALQTKLRNTTHMATTVGYGPRFLHSTGQLHKGDAGRGLFIQFMADMPQDADIPDEAGEDASTMSFGTLKEAQALGDRAALLDANRHVIRFRFSDTVAGLKMLTDAL